jgi:cyclic beta-1,2-glucan synthetase
MVDPERAMRNFERLAIIGAAAPFMVRLDYTVRGPDDADVAIVRAYMAHHQGMTIVGCNVLLDGTMRGDFTRTQRSGDGITCRACRAMFGGSSRAEEENTAAPH